MQRFSGCRQSIARVLAGLWLGVVAGAAAGPSDPGAPADAESGAYARTIAEVLDLPIAVLQERPTVRVRGTAVWFYSRAIVLQDGPVGIFVDLVEAEDAGVWGGGAIPAETRLGSIIEVEGRAVPSGFSPAILPHAIRIVGEGPVPEPRSPDPDRFFSGAHVGTLVRVAGIVQGVAPGPIRDTLSIEMQGRVVQAEVDNRVLGPDPDRLLDATVQVTGVNFSKVNVRGEMVAPIVYVDTSADLVILSPPPADPFAVPEIPLSSIGRFRREPRPGRMIRAKGVVLDARPGEVVYLQEGINGLQAKTTSTEALLPGDKVEVAGFIDRSGRVAGLTGALVRRISAGPPPLATRITPDEVVAVNTRAAGERQMALPGDYEGCLIEFDADLVAVDRSGDGAGVLTLSAGKTSVAAVCRPEAFAALQRVSAGSRVTVTGIAHSIPSTTKAGAVDRMALLLRSAGDVRVLRTPPWWTPRRLGIALAGTLAALTAVGLAATAWITVLRWRVAAQLGIIEENLQATAVAEERRRIAREFHDSLDQGLAALSLRLGAAARQTEDESTRSLVLQQRRFLGSLQKEARDFLWDLRYPTHVGGSLRESIWTQLIHLGSHTPVPLELETHGEPIDLPPLVHYQLVRIVREAVNNAIKYARAKRIVVRIETAPGSTPGLLRLEVRDDGEGFDVAGRSEAEGHFGIRGMQERARQIGAELAIGSVPGRGTTLSVTLPSPGRPEPSPVAVGSVAG